MSQTKDKKNNKNTADNAESQVWKNPQLVTAVSGILTEIITENAREISSSKNKGNFMN